MSIIQIENVHFSYNSKEKILDALNLSVPEGSIYGFLGANGAGKSTTIRNLLGLLKPSKGSIQLFGQHRAHSIPSVFANIGSLIEDPSLYSQLSASQNLKIACQYNGVEMDTIAPTLERVGLTWARDKKVKNFSMGMKQRLGLGIAILHDPQLLILDEPINGLDPTGISEIREIVLRLNQEGKTIMLSSHLLSEIEKTVSHIGILKSGKMLFEGSLDELNSLKNSQVVIALRCNQPTRVESIPGLEIEKESTGGIVFLRAGSEDQIPIIVKKLIEHEIDIYEISILKSDLESLFIEMTNN